MKVLNLQIVFFFRNVLSFSVIQQPTRQLHRNVLKSSSADISTLDSKSSNLEQALDQCRSDVTKTCKVIVGPSPSTGRLGLIASQNINKNDVILSMPYDDSLEISAQTARKNV